MVDGAAARAAASKVNPQTRGDKIAQLKEKSAAQLARLADIEQQIYDLEGSYLEETQQSGSSLQTWDAGLLRKDLKREAHKGAKRKLNENSRIFSNSSATSGTHKWAKSRSAAQAT